MAKVQINFFIDVEVNEEDGHSWKALSEAYYIIKDILSQDERVGDVYLEGISKVY